MRTKVARKDVLHDWDVKAIESAIESTVASADFKDASAEHPWLLEEIAGCWEGVYQVQTVLDAFRIPWRAGEYDVSILWEVVDEVAEDVADVLREELQEVLSRYNVSLGFGHTYIGDYGLLLWPEDD